MDKQVVVVNAIVQFKDKFLILKRNKNLEVHPGKWSFPGGKVILGEDLFSTLKREIKEEANLDIENKKEFISDYAFQRPSGDYSIGICFRVSAKNDKVKLNKEHIDYSWIKPDEVEKYDLIEYLKPEVKKAFNI